MIRLTTSSIKKRLFAAGCKIIGMRAFFESTSFDGKTLKEEVLFRLPELNADLYTHIKTNEGEDIYIGPSGIWYEVDGLSYNSSGDSVEFLDPIFGGDEETLNDSALTVSLDKFYNSAIIDSRIVKPVDFPLYALLERGRLSVTSSVNDDAVAFRENVHGITLDHIIDHWRVPLRCVSELRDVYLQWAGWRKGMLAPHIDGSDFDLDDETSGLSFQDQDVIEHLKYNERCFVDHDIDRCNVYLPSVDEIEAVDMLMYSVEQLQDDYDVVFPSRIHDIARAWSLYEEAREKVTNLG